MSIGRGGRWRSAGELGLLSFAVLFQELTLIRWLAGQVRVLAYFPNLVLMAAFLGLGLGCLRAKSVARPWLWAASLLVITAAAWGLSKIAFTEESVSEHLWLLYYDMKDAPVVHGVRLPIIGVFILATVSFIVPGQMVAQRLARFRGDESGAGGSLWGYFADLSGSLVGVAGFALASFWQTFPVVWFAIVLAVAGAVFLLGGDLLRRAVGLATFATCAAGVLIIVHYAEPAERYSPYYAVRAVTHHGVKWFDVLVNGSLHQHAAQMRWNDAIDTEGQRLLRTGYHSPYRYLSAPPRRVLILGAGTGNDVATALDEGAEHVDAVEIDPVILGLGRQYHPDRPYTSDRVRAINTDARNFLNRSSEKYDLIVFGTLDSMTRLSALSSVRLDNFVYTRDCLAAARRHLTADGGIMMYFMVGTDFIGKRLWYMLDDVFGTPPLVQQQSFGMFNYVFMDGSAFDKGRTMLPAMDGGTDYGEVPTDDWPYLYLRWRGVNLFYLSLGAAILAVAAVGLTLVSPSTVRNVLRRSGGFDAEMLLFGVAFLLLETKSVTEMGLVWGVTWLTSAVVFGAVLLTLLAATAVTQLRPMPLWLAVVGLTMALIAGYAVPTHLLVGRSTAVAFGLSVLVVGLPIFFASICFALRFRTRSLPDVAFAWNLLGAVGGGLLEFMSMSIGSRALSLLALGLYLVALGWGARGGRATITAPEAEAVTV